jgi:hypothetical protein
VPRTEQMLCLFACTAAAALLNASVDIYDYIGDVPTYSLDACRRIAANAANYSCLTVELMPTTCSLYLDYACMRRSPLADCTAMFEGVRGGNSCIAQHRTGGLPSCTAIKHPTCNTTPRQPLSVSQPPVVVSAARRHVLAAFAWLCAVGAFQ